MSPLIEIGFWKISPGGWTVTVWICGRRFRCRYAAVRVSRTGVWPALPARATFNCRKRARSLDTGSPSGRT